MEISLDSNLKGISKKVSNQGKELKGSVKSALLKTALHGINIIEDRTAENRGLKGRFPKYSQKYLEFRESKGRGKNVDLQFTGKMLGSMSAISTSRYAEIYFMRGAEAQKAAGVGKKRPFFGFSRKERHRLAEFLFKALK
tara:strand:- start:36 stop:455 length:420 start_codon:yes stop_codon:yes gene_type:complete